VVSIRIFKPSLPTLEQLAPYIKEIDRTRQYSNFGPLTKLLEARFANHIGSDPENVATCVNATLALTGAAHILNPSRQSWKLPVYTFVATAHAVLNAGQTFNLRDIAADLHMDTTDIHNDEYVLHVLPFGDSFPSHAYQNFQGNMLIDAAASYDAVRDFASKMHLKGRVVLVVSLHPTKYPGGAEGALIYSNDPEFIEMFHKWTVFGFDNSRRSLTLGTNAKMSEYSAAVANASLDSWNEKKILIHNKMDKALTISQEFGFDVNPAMKKRYINPYWTVFTQDQDRLERLKVILRKSGVEYRTWWGEGLHKHPSLTRALSMQIFPVCDQVVNRSVSLPFYEELNDEDFSYIESVLVHV